MSGLQAQGSRWWRRERHALRRPRLLARACATAALRGFFADLRITTHSDIAAFNSRGAYDYFQRDVEDQGRFRDELYDIFTKQMQNHSQ